MDFAKAARAEARAKSSTKVTDVGRTLFPLALLLALSLSTGCLHRPAAPVTLACATAPTAVFPGDPVTVTGAAENFDPQKTLQWSWTSAIGSIAGRSNAVTLNTVGLSPGTYSVTGHVRRDAKSGETAECSASFVVKPFEPPTISCSANPATIQPGQTSIITATGMSPQNRPLTYSYSAYSGTVRGSGSSATFESAGASTGPVGIMCNVVDDKGQTATADTTVSISAPPAPPPPHGRIFDCSALPSSVRAGDPVVLSLASHEPGDSVVWHSIAGILDAGVDTAVVDTKNLNFGAVPVQADILHSGAQVGSCRTTFVVDPNASAAPWPTLNIVRIPLKEGERENSGFAVYTYVLYRRKPASPDEVLRFKNILAAIAAHPSAEDFGQTALAPTAQPPLHVKPTTAGRIATSRRELAPIIVPVTAVGPFTVDWLFDNYDPAFASQLLANLSCQRATNRTNCRSRLSGDGPFLISTVVRLTGHPEGFLVQDIGKTSPEAGGEWVADYMSMVTTQANWTHGYTLQRAALDFADSLDAIGGELQRSAPAVRQAIAFFKFN